MIATLERNRELGERSDILTRLDLSPGHYSAVTMRRPASADDLEIMGRQVAVFKVLQMD
jgi:hypothetical protein